MILNATNLAMIAGVGMGLAGLGNDPAGNTPAQRAAYFVPRCRDHKAGRVNLPNACANARRALQNAGMPIPADIATDGPAAAPTPPAAPAAASGPGETPAQRADYFHRRCQRHRAGQIAAPDACANARRAYGNAGLPLPADLADPSASAAVAPTPAAAPAPTTPASSPAAPQNTPAIGPAAAVTPPPAPPSSPANAPNAPDPAATAAIAPTPGQPATPVASSPPAPGRVDPDVAAARYRDFRARCIEHKAGRASYPNACANARRAAGNAGIPITPDIEDAAPAPAPTPGEPPRPQPLPALPTDPAAGAAVAPVDRSNPANMTPRERFFYFRGRCLKHARGEIDAPNACDNAVRAAENAGIELTDPDAALPDTSTPPANLTPTTPGTPAAGTDAPAKGRTALIVGGVAAVGLVGLLVFAGGKKGGRR